jgi:hypothetical protein
MQYVLAETLLTQHSDFSRDLSRADRHPCQAHRQLEPPRPRAARIEIKHAVLRLLLRNVAVPRDHNSESCSCRFQIELRQIVQHINGNAAELNNLSLGQLARPRFNIDIAANRGDRRKRRELVKNLRRANVACVNDVLRPAQRLQRFRTKQPVRVGDDADEEGGSQFSVLSSQFSVLRLCFQQLIHFGVRGSIRH